MLLETGRKVAPDLLATEKRALRAGEQMVSFDKGVGIGTASLHLLALTGASFALPLYEVLSEGSHFFVARRSAPRKDDAILLNGCVATVGSPVAAQVPSYPYRPRSRPRLAGSRRTE